MHSFGCAFLLPLLPNFAKIHARVGRGRLERAPRDSIPPRGHSHFRGLKGHPMKNQTFGIEIETTGLGLKRTAEAIAAPLR